jgi:hypothetical protein
MEQQQNTLTKERVDLALS